MASENWVPLIAAADLPAGEMVAVEVGEQKIAGYNVDGRFFATANVCTHAFALLSDGWFEEGVVECPLHGGRFDVTSGAAVGEPAECPLQTYAVRVADEQIEVLVVE